MEWYRLALGVLVAWRITHLFNAEDGPWEIFVKFRQRVGNGFWGELLDCFYCLSLWIAAPLAIVLGTGIWGRLLLWPALSAGAILLERLTTSKQSESPPLYFEEPEKENVLWQESKIDE